MNATGEASPNLTTFGSSLFFRSIVSGCVLAIGGNVLISIALNIQKYVHMTNPKHSEAAGGEEHVEKVVSEPVISSKETTPITSEPQQQKLPHYTRRPLWWLGMVLILVGEIGNFTAYGFAPASMVAPLGTTAVIANVFIAITFLHEKLRPIDIGGTCSALLGAILIVSFARKSADFQQKGEAVLSGPQLMEKVWKLPVLLYFMFEGLILLVLLLLHHYVGNSSAIVLLLIAAIIASWTIISAKGLSGMIQLSIDGNLQWRYPILYIMFFVLLFTGIAQVVYINRAMKTHDSTLVVPTNFVFFTISAILSGIVFFDEFRDLATTQIFLFLLGCIFSFIGVFLIQYGRPAGPHEPGEQSVKTGEHPHLCSFCFNFTSPSQATASAASSTFTVTSQPAAGEAEGGTANPVSKHVDETASLVRTAQDQPVVIGKDYTNLQSDSLPK